MKSATGLFRDPRDYRLYAFQCAELAMRARTPELKATFLELSANWAKLARDVETLEALLTEAGDAAPASDGTESTIGC
jgi:hypothetical protein